MKQKYIISVDAHEVIVSPLATEKSVRLMEAENKLIFLIGKNATKNAVKAAVEKLFQVKVAAVNTHVMNGEKRAYVQLTPAFRAIDVATKLGLL